MAGPVGVFDGSEHGRVIGEYFHRPDDRPGGVVNRRGPNPHRFPVAVGVPQPDGHLTRLPVADGRGQRADGVAKVVSLAVDVVQDVVEAAMPDDVRRPIAGDPLGAAVPVFDLPPGIDEVNAVGQVVDDRLVEIVVQFAVGHRQGLRTAVGAPGYVTSGRLRNSTLRHRGGRDLAPAIAWRNRETASRGPPLACAGTNSGRADVPSAAWPTSTRCFRYIRPRNRK